MGSWGRGVMKVGQGKEDRLGLVSTMMPQVTALGTSLLHFSHPSKNAVMSRW